MNSAEIILSQLGGTRRLNIMIGAKDIYSDNDGKTLMFSFPNKRRSKPNFITITHNSKDLYDVVFGRKGMKKDKDLGFSVPNYTELKTYDDIYADMLMDIFEKETDLFLTLTPRN